LNFQREWRNPVDGTVDKGSKFNQHVESILSVFFGLADDKMKALTDYKNGVSKI